MCGGGGGGGGLLIMHDNWKRFRVGCAGYDFVSSLFLIFLVANLNILGR